MLFDPTATHSQGCLFLTNLSWPDPGQLALHSALGQEIRAGYLIAQGLGDSFLLHIVSAPKASCLVEKPGISPHD
jgi:hypothetical protein